RCAALPALLRRGLPVVAAAAALVLTLTVGFVSDTAIGGLIPTGESVRRFLALIRAGEASIARQSLPATADDGIGFLIAAGLGVLVLLACIVTFSLRAPAAAGLPLVVVFLLPSLVPGASTDPSAFAVAAAGYLLLLTAGRSRQTLPAAAIGAAAIVAALVLPSALPPSAAALTLGGAGSLPGLATGVNPMLSLGNDLRRTVSAPVLTYTTRSGDSYYLRLTTVSSFSGKDWSPDAPAMNPANTPARFPPPPGLAPDVATSQEISYLHVADLASGWLPAPYPVSQIFGLTGRWSWQPRDLTVASTGSLARGQNYTVVSILVQPTPEQLQSAGTAVPPGFGRYLELPAGMPPSIAATARQVAGAAVSNYEKALALQGFFRSGDFAYSEQAPVRDGYDGTGVAAIARFLQVRSGYCIHFASAMAVMARTLGIPSRIAVGFQPGRPQSGTDVGRSIYQVTTRDLHAWPELYFSGIGWVSFEPTPGRGVLPDYANQLLPGVPVAAPALQAPVRNPSQVPSVGALPRLAAGSSVVGWLSNGDQGGWPAAVLALAVLTMLILTPAGIRSSRRRRRLARLRKGTGTAMLAWREVLETAEDAGARPSSTLTPRAAVERLSRIQGVTEPAKAALARIGAVLERELYGPPRGIDPAALAGLAGDVERVVCCLRPQRGAGRRARSFLLPSSLLSGRLRRVSPPGTSRLRRAGVEWR
ncbi:MAG: transglutaminase TgpA family protein, partial [Microbacteriaceae bacterium]